MTTPKRHRLQALTCAAVLTLAAAAPGQPLARAVPIVLSPRATDAERLAAQDLADTLQRLHPGERFVLGEGLPETGRAVLVGNAAVDPALRRHLGGDVPAAPESFVVMTATDGARQLGLIAGADSRGVAYGVYALLEKLGCGFYLSGDAWPAPTTNAFSFEGWRLADRPLVRDRIVFNWHNFLSGCSTWNFADWQRWTAQSRKLGYNAIMVHAYGNNPMVRFTFNGRTKPVGYLSTTVKGRDWATMHVNDVRRLWGGEVFAGPAFGADAALVPDAQRAAAAERLMREVFADAARRGMGVVFAVDVDTVSANPQELILPLPPEARFAIQVKALGWMGQEAGGMWLANPDTPEGHCYYRAQVEALLRAYPQVTCLVAWFRRGGTPWLEMKETEWPPAPPWANTWSAGSPTPPRSRARPVTSSLTGRSLRRAPWRQDAPRGCSTSKPWTRPRLPPSNAACGYAACHAM